MGFFHDVKSVAKLSLTAKLAGRLHRFPIGTNNDQFIHEIIFYICNLLKHTYIADSIDL